MIYKGYSASIEANIESGFFHGRILGISEIIAFEGNTLEELIADFHNGVDHYLADCEESDVDPSVPASGNHPLKMPPLLHAVGKSHAKQKGTNFNAYVVNLITQDLKNDTGIPVSS